MFVQNFRTKLLRHDHLPVGAEAISRLPPVFKNTIVESERVPLGPEVLRFLPKVADLVPFWPQLSTVQMTKNGPNVAIFLLS